MNKELIKKYKAEFDHWLNGGEVLFYTWKWYNSKDNPSSTFNHSDPSVIKYYVINDAFVEFRKALAEGKTLQYNFGNFGTNKKDFPYSWKDLDLSIGILADRACPENYRIKPEEPKFKVGDCVRDLRDNRVFQINSVNFNLKLSIKNTVYVHWQPKKGEWCWFSNKNGIPTIGQFLSIETDGNRKYSATFPNTPHPFITYYDYCEPFLGQLPTNIQEAL